MRAFHYAWLSFFLAFTGWFALAPLAPILRVSLGLCDNGDWNDFSSPRDCKCGARCRAALANANTVSVAGTIGMRLLVGAWAETYGPRFSQAFMVMLFSVPLACAGAVTTGASLAAVRFFIGGMGATFVITQFWTSVMFSKNIVGTANATSAGWGNLGGGFTQVFMPFVLSWFISYGYDLAWRLAVLVPAFLLFFVGIMVSRRDRRHAQFPACARTSPRALQPWRARLTARLPAHPHDPLLHFTALHDVRRCSRGHVQGALRLG